MHDAGLSTIEAERKNQLMETVARVQRQSFLTSKLREIEKKYQRKAMGNIVDSSLLAARQGRFPNLAGMVTDRWSKKQTEEQDEQEAPSAQPSVQPDAQPAAAEQLRRQQQQGRLNQLKQEMLEKGGPSASQKKKEQEKVRKQMKNAVRRGSEEAAQGIGNIIDFGTTGISTLVTVFVYAFTLVDLNLQMFSYYYKNKKIDFFFPALTWDPIPMPKIVSARFLHIGLAVLDLLVVMFLVFGLMAAAVVIILPVIVSTMPAWAIFTYISDPSLRTMINSMIGELAF